MAKITTQEESNVATNALNPIENLEPGDNKRLAMTLNCILYNF